MQQVNNGISVAYGLLMGSHHHHIPERVQCVLNIIFLRLRFYCICCLTRIYSPWLFASPNQCCAWLVYGIFLASVYFFYVLHCLANGPDVKWVAKLIQICRLIAIGLDFIKYKKKIINKIRNNPKINPSNLVYSVGIILHRYSQGVLYR